MDRDRPEVVQEHPPQMRPDGKPTELVKAEGPEYQQTVIIENLLAETDVQEGFFALDAGHEIIELKIMLIEDPVGAPQFIDGRNPEAGRETLELGDIAVLSAGDFTANHLLRSTGSAWTSVAVADLEPVDTWSHVFSLAGSGSGGTTAVALNCNGSDVDGDRGVPLAYDCSAARISLSMKHLSAIGSRPWKATLHRIRDGSSTAVATFSFTV